MWSSLPARGAHFQHEPWYEHSACFELTMWLSPKLKENPSQSTVWGIRALRSTRDPSLGPEIPGYSRRRLCAGVQESCGNHHGDPSWSSERFPGAAQGDGRGAGCGYLRVQRQGIFKLWPENLDLLEKFLISICSFPKVHVTEMRRGRLGNAGGIMGKPDSSPC